MTRKHRQAFIFLSFALLLFICGTAWGQERDFSQIVVHVWGEVNTPGEYRIPDGTDVLGLISKAGGPTENSRLNKVRLTKTLGDISRSGQRSLAATNGGTSSAKRSGRRQIQPQKRVFEIDLNRYLKQERATQSLPMLQTGDVVYIPRNRLSGWRTVASIVRDIAIVANAYYWIQQGNR